MVDIAKDMFKLLKQAIQDWFEDNASRQAAALAYYGVLSLAPLLVIAIAVAGLFFGQADVQQQIVTEAEQVLGSGGAEMVNNVLEATYSNSGGIIATITSVFVLFFAATNIFFQLKTTLNRIWEVEEEDNKFIEGIVKMIKDRLIAAVMVIGVGFTLLLSQVLGTTILVVTSAADSLPVNTTLLLRFFNIFATIGFSTLIISLIFRFLPDKKLSWKDVWVGSLFTAVLFAVGQRLLGLYLENSSAASAYGVAGSLIVLLLWIYYSSNILLFGAEFTHAYARLYGSETETEEERSPNPSTAQEPA